MQPASLGRTDLSIGHLAQLIMGEVIGVRTAFPYDPFVPEFVQRTDVQPGDYGVLLAMGPGFCSELVLLKW